MVPSPHVNFNEVMINFRKTNYLLWCMVARTKVQNPYLLKVQVRNNMYWVQKVLGKVLDKPTINLSKAANLYRFMQYRHGSLYKDKDKNIVLTHHQFLHKKS